MYNSRDIRLRIRAVKQTLQVTKAMNLISAAKLRKSRRMLEDTEPYFKRIQKSMFDILSAAGKVDSVFFHKNNPAIPRKTAIVVITSDKGLAGGYNANIIRKANDLCMRVKNPKLILIGAVGSRHFTHLTYPVMENISYQSQIPTLEHADDIAKYILAQYLKGACDEVHIVYTIMHSSVKLEPTEWQILPLSTVKIQEELSSLGSKKRVELHFEFIPSEEDLFNALVPLYIRGIIYGCMVEAYTSEQSSRMAAMDEASKNADKMLGDLQLKNNRARQAGITQEMTEIASGFAALSGR